MIILLVLIFYIAGLVSYAIGIFWFLFPVIFFYFVMKPIVNDLTKKYYGGHWSNDPIRAYQYQRNQNG